MKKKILIGLFSFLILFLLVSSSVLAVEDPYYDNDEYNKIQTFLNQTSDDGVKTNGERINASYNANDPTTWTGVVWSADTHKRVEHISWVNKGLAGSLDLSGFTSLKTLACPQNYITSIDLSGDTVLTLIDAANNQLTSLDVDANLTYLDCSFNNIQGTLDLSAMPALEEAYCSNNKITQLNISDGNNLKTLECSNNELSGTLDVSELSDLTKLRCTDNSLSSLILSKGPRYDELFTINNKIKTITTDMFGPGQTFTANGDGYISLNIIDFLAQQIIILIAEPNPDSNSIFYNWTYEGTTEASKSPIHYLDLAQPPTVDIQANFKPALTSDPADGVIYTGGRVSLTPFIAGGEWQYDTSYLQADFTNPNKPVFKGLKPGKTQISYTFDPGYVIEDLPGSVGVTGISEEEDGNITVTMDITVKTPLLPVTGQNFTIAIILALIGLTAIIAMAAIKRKSKRT